VPGRAGASDAIAIGQDEVLAVARAMAAEGLRVLAVAVREWQQLPPGEEEAVESGLLLLGLVGMLAPPAPRRSRSLRGRGWSP